MAAKSTLNAKNLEALGAERLSELLIELSTGNAAAKRRLRLELAGLQIQEKLQKRSASAFRQFRDREALLTGIINVN